MVHGAKKAKCQFPFGQRLEIDTRRELGDRDTDTDWVSIGKKTENDLLVVDSQSAVVSF